MIKLIKKKGSGGAEFHDKSRHQSTHPNMLKPKVHGRRVVKGNGQILATGSRVISETLNYSLPLTNGALSHIGPISIRLSCAIRDPRESAIAPDIRDIRGAPGTGPGTPPPQKNSNKTRGTNKILVFTHPAKYSFFPPLSTLQLDHSVVPRSCTLLLLIC